jgi:very-short-patch-repair endonuclease
MPNERARLLRKNLTDAEHRLWSKLRGRQDAGHKFRRQAPIGPYVVDFLCSQRKLIVEVDGGQHAARAVADAQRTAFLEREGYRVIRFWNNEVSGNLEGVFEAIHQALSE